MSPTEILRTKFKGSLEPHLPHGVPLAWNHRYYCFFVIFSLICIIITFSFSKYHSDIYCLIVQKIYKALYTALQKFLIAIKPW